MLAALTVIHRGSVHVSGSMEASPANTAKASHLLSCGTKRDSVHPFSLVFFSPTSNTHTLRGKVANVTWRSWSGMFHILSVDRHEHIRELQVLTSGLAVHEFFACDFQKALKVLYDWQWNVTICLRESHLTFRKFLTVNQREKCSHVYYWQQRQEMHRLSWNNNNNINNTIKTSNPFSPCVNFFFSRRLYPKAARSCDRVVTASPPGLLLPPSSALVPPLSSLWTHNKVCLSDFGKQKLSKQRTVLFLLL